MVSTKNEKPEALAPSEDSSLDEIVDKFNGRWVAIIVTKRDTNMQPARGQVVADDVDRYRLRQNILKYRDICIFYAGDPPYPVLL